MFISHLDQLLYSTLSKNILIIYVLVSNRAYFIILYLQNTFSFERGFGVLGFWGLGFRD